MDSPDRAGDGCRPDPGPADACLGSLVAPVSAQTRVPKKPALLPRLSRWWPLALALSALIAIAGPAAWGTAGATTWGAPVLQVTGVPSRQFLPMIGKQPTPTPVPAGLRPSDFGLVFVNSGETPYGDQRIQRGADTGARLDRFPLYWDLIEPSPGNFTWEKQDRALAANESHGLGTLGILLGVPGSYYPANVQASSIQPLPPIGGSIYRSLGSVSPLSAQGTCTGGGPPTPAGLYNPIFADNTDLPGTSAAVKPINAGNPWAHFVDQIVNRYRPGGVKGLHVSHWEVWNEPDLCQFWRGTAPQYARLLKVAYLVIKQRDPQATVVMGGLAHFEQPGFLGELLDTLKADPLSGRYNGFFDAAGAHHYAILWNGYTWTNDMRNALSARGWAGKPIWITESGVPVCNDYPGPPCPSPWRASPEEQAAYIWENVAYTRMAGAGPIFQFNLFDDCGNVVAPDSPDGFGLIKNESTSYCSNQGNGAPRLSYTAFTLANRYLAGTELLWYDVQPTSLPRGRRFAFYDPVSGERRTMVFAVDAATTVTLPATAAQARRLALNGSETILTPANGQYQIPLAGPTNHNSPTSDPPECSDAKPCKAGIYGIPYLIIERDTQPPATSIAGLPAASPLSFPVSWTAGDLGSGLARIDLYYQKDDGPWQLWWSGLRQGDRLNTSGTQQFTGERGHRYRFAVMALDSAGNVPGAPVAQAETRTDG